MLSVGGRKRQREVILNLIRTVFVLLPFQAQDKLEEKSESSGPLSTGNINLINDINKYCQKVIDLDAQELVSILSKPHFKSLLGTHDSIAERYNFPSSPDLAPLAEIDSIDLYPNGTAMTADAIRVIGLRKNPNEPLGLTVEEDENGNLVVARILAGGMIDKQVGEIADMSVIVLVTCMDCYTCDSLSLCEVTDKQNLLNRFLANL